MLQNSVSSQPLTRVEKGKCVHLPEMLRDWNLIFLEQQEYDFSNPEER